MTARTKQEIEQAVEQIRAGFEALGFWTAQCEPPSSGTKVLVDPDHPGSWLRIAHNYDGKRAGIVVSVDGIFRDKRWVEFKRLLKDEPTPPESSPTSSRPPR